MPTNKVTQKFKKHICFGYQANTNIGWHYRTTVPPSDRNAMDKLNRLPSSLIIPQSDYDCAEIYTLCRNEPSILKHGAEKYPLHRNEPSVPMYSTKANTIYSMLDFVLIWL